MRAHPALVLNADFQPLNYFPLSTMDWQTAVKNIYESNLSVVAEYDEVVRSPSRTMRLPSALRSRGSTCSCGIGFVASIAASGSPPINSRSITSSHAHLVA